MQLSLMAQSACRVARADGVKARICPGNRCARNWWSKLLMTTCKEIAFVTPHSFAAGDRTRSLSIAHTRNWKWSHLRNWPPSSLPDDKAGQVSLFLWRVCSLFHSRHSRVGSSSGSGGPCIGRRFSGTCCRLIRMRVQVEDLPRMESTRTSSGARNSTAPACRAFHRSRPARAATLSGELAITIKGILTRGVLALDLAREGATLGPSD